MEQPGRVEGVPGDGMDFKVPSHPNHSTCSQQRVQQVKIRVVSHSYLLTAFPRAVPGKVVPLSVATELLPHVGSTPGAQGAPILWGGRLFKEVLLESKFLHVLSPCIKNIPWNSSPSEACPGSRCGLTWLSQGELLIPPETYPARQCCCSWNTREHGQGNVRCPDWSSLTRILQSSSWPCTGHPKKIPLVPKS